MMKATNNTPGDAPTSDEPSHRCVVRPFFGSEGGLDVTRPLVAAIALELKREFGGNDVLNWIEAERLLGEALEGSGS